MFLLLINFLFIKLEFKTFLRKSNSKLVDDVNLLLLKLLPKQWDIIGKTKKLTHLSKSVKEQNDDDSNQ